MSENVDPKRERSTVIDLSNVTLTGSGTSAMLHGAKATVTFTFARDEEALKAKRWSTVRDLTIDCGGVPLLNLIGSAIANYVVALQANRKDADVLLKLSGGNIKFGGSLSTRRAKTITVIKARELTELEKIRLVIEQMEKMGIDVPIAALEAEYQLEHPELISKFIPE